MNIFSNKNRAYFLSCFLLLILFFTYCQSGQKIIDKRYSEGFALKHPADWHAQVLDKAYIWISSKEERTDGSFILIHPFFLKRAVQSRSWLQQNLPQLSKFFTEAAIEKTGQIRKLPDEAAAKFIFKRENKSYQGIALCSTQGKSGILYVIASPEGTFEEHQEQMISMLESFRFEEPEKSPTQAAAQPQIQYRNWQDTREQAFSLEVPQKWTVGGGTFRRAAVDLVHVLRAVSPDQKILIQFNDSNIPVFTVPSPMLTMAGFREGTWYSPGYGVQMMVKRYTPGFYFITEYLQSNFGHRLANFKIVSQKNRPDIASSFNQIYSQLMSYGISFTLHAGEAAFSFEQNSQPYVGYGMALTQIAQSVGTQTGTWSVALMVIYSCPAAETDTVRQISDHMFRSMKMNPRWLSSQQQLAGNVSQIVSQTSQEISNIINDSYWSRQSVLDNTNRRFSNYILGVTDVIDPDTGEKWKVEAGHNYYWRRDFTNQIIGSDTFDRPDIDFSPLREFQD